MRQGTLLSLTSLLVAGLIISGCARHLVGTPIKVKNIPKIAVGKTTRTEIFRLFGSPYTVESKGDRETLTYVHGREFTWSIGVYTEREEKADVLTVYIDQNGIVSDYSFSEGAAIPDIYKKPVRPPF